MTFTWLYLWFFIATQSLTVIFAVFALFSRAIPITNRLTFFVTAISRVTAAVWLGFYMLDLLEAEALDSLWILLIVCAFTIAEWFVKRLTEKHLLKMPVPSFREFFS